jgi:uncharacterized protein (TIGR02646 family)
MHELQRNPVAPTCLNKYQHGRDQWSMQSPTYDERQEIWNQLNAMQGHRCAYCEADISNGQKHIEHFRQKGRDATVTFLWSNLFGSCNRKDSCGKHKDGCGDYNPSDLIKPDVDDPEHFFVFVPDGTIAIRQGLSKADKHRATETLRIFNLDAQHGPLRRMRQQAAVGYQQTVEEILALAADYPPEEWQPLLDSEVATTADLPFATAIKHALMRQN